MYNLFTSYKMSWEKNVTFNEIEINVINNLKEKNYSKN